VVNLVMQSFVIVTRMFSTALHKLIVVNLVMQ
jgi:hypothetical protein